MSARHGSTVAVLKALIQCLEFFVAFKICDGLLRPVITFGKDIFHEIWGSLCRLYNPH
jgi:hypothetical protein